MVGPVRFSGIGVDVVAQDKDCGGPVLRNPALVLPLDAESGLVARVPGALVLVEGGDDILGGLDLAPQGVALGQGSGGLEAAQLAKPRGG